MVLTVPAGRAVAGHAPVSAMSSKDALIRPVQYGNETKQHEEAGQETQTRQLQQVGADRQVQGTRDERQKDLKVDGQVHEDPPTAQASQNSDAARHDEAVRLLTPGDGDGTALQGRLT